jgi:hypothetical protein
LAYISGRDTERRDQAPAAYSDAAKNKAQQDCIGSEGSAAFECIYEKVKASQEQARAEQDLDAQQRSANGTAITAIIALIGLAVSVVGIGLVYTTFNETRKSNALIHDAQRAWISVELKPTFIHPTIPKGWKGPDENPEEIRVSAGITLKNIGNSSAKIESVYFFCIPVGTMSAENIEGMTRSEANMIHHVPNAIIPTGKIEIDIIKAFPFNWVEGSGHRFNVIAVVEVVYSVGFTRCTFLLSPDGASDTAFHRFGHVSTDGIKSEPYRYQKYE